MRDPYTILGVARDAPDFVVQAAYRACLKRYHPDHYKGADAAARTAEVVEAYDTIRKQARHHAQNGGTRTDGQRARATAQSAPSPSQKERGDSSRVPPTVTSQEKPKVAWLLVLIPIGIGLVIAGQSNESPPYSPRYLTSGAEISEVPADKLMPEAAAPITAVPTFVDELKTSQETNGFPSIAEPISFNNIESAARKFAEILPKSGTMGARAFSEECHRSQGANPSWSGLDYCAAFDFAADGMDRSFTRYPSTRRSAYFQFQAANQSDFYSGRYVFDRLQRIQRAALTALADSPPVLDGGKETMPQSPSPAPTSAIVSDRSPSSTLVPPAQNTFEQRFEIDRNGNLIDNSAE